MCVGWEGMGEEGSVKHRRWSAWKGVLALRWSVRKRSARKFEWVKRISAHVWMPRHRPAKKDVASCEKLRGAASRL